MFVKFISALAACSISLSALLPSPGFSREVPKGPQVEQDVAGWPHTVVNRGVVA